MRYGAALMFPPPPPWSSRIFTVGVTGTNGKTTTTTYLAAALGCASPGVSRITTVGSFFGPDKLDVQPTYDGFVQAMHYGLERGSRFAAVEVTSEALAAGFAKAWPFSMGVFTNLTRDHLDAHGSPEHYLASKAQLFVHLPAFGVAVLNAFDPASALIAEVIPAGVRIVSYGVPSRSSGPPVIEVDVLAEQAHVGWDGTRVKLRWSSRVAQVEQELNLRAIGAVYAENALAALLAAMEVGIPCREAAAAIANTPAPPGRFEVIGHGPRAVVDYGHSPDALERTLKTARALCSGCLSVVFGAGGGRDRGKREQMGKAVKIADRIYLTNDNPRQEDPVLIAQAIRRGIGEHSAVFTILDREEAITTALEGVRSEDVVVIAGRGPETEQVLSSGLRALVDAEVARRALGLAENAPTV